MLWNKVALCQEEGDRKNTGFWQQQYNLGISAGYPTIPFLNLGVLFNQKVYAEAFIEPVYSRVQSNYFTLGYHQRNLFKRNISGQIGLSYMQVPGKIKAQKVSSPGMNLKLLFPISKRFGMYVSGFMAYPDNRMGQGKQTNLNIGINLYIDEFPNPAFWLK